jgi:hypothetical protein
MKTVKSTTALDVFTDAFWRRGSVPGCPGVPARRPVFVVPFSARSWRETAPDSPRSAIVVPRKLPNIRNMVSRRTVANMPHPDFIRSRRPV